MTTTNDNVAEARIGQALPPAGDIRDIIERKRKDERDKELRQRREVEEELKHQKEIFGARKLTPEFIDTVMRRVRRAAENGEYNILVGQFPGEWCSDRGRSINVRRGRLARHAARIRAGFL